jgi:hypothetical protein
MATEMMVDNDDVVLRGRKEEKRKKKGNGGRPKEGRKEGSSVGCERRGCLKERVQLYSYRAKQAEMEKESAVQETRRPSKARMHNMKAGKKGGRK